MNLTQMKSGSRAVITGIRGGAGILRKLEILGIRPGISIIKISAQLMKGPVVIKIGNTQMALGYGMAKRIELEEAK